MTIVIHALAMLCGLGSASFASIGRDRTLLRVAALTVGFVGAVVWVKPDRIPDAATTGVAVALVAILQITQPRLLSRVGEGLGLATLCAGLLAGMLGSLLRLEGVPAVPALLIAGAIPTVAAIMSVGRPKFAPAALQEEALLVVFALGIVVAVIPSISSGWGTALTLNRQAGSGAPQVVSTWVLVLSGASAALGGIYTLWRRR